MNGYETFYRTFAEEASRRANRALIYGHTFKELVIACNEADMWKTKAESEGRREVLRYSKSLETLAD